MNEHLPAISSHQCLLIDNQVEFEIQEVRSLPAEQHPFHENLKILSDLAVSGINHEFQLDCGLLAVDFQLRR